MKIKNLKVGILVGGLVVLGVMHWEKNAKTSLEYTAVYYDAESGKPAGFLSYEEVSQYLKIVTLEDNGNQFEELMYVPEYYQKYGRHHAYWYEKDYIRLEDGWKMGTHEYMSYEDQEKGIPAKSSGVFTIVKEENFIDDLLEYTDRKEEYDVEEILRVYQEKVSSEAKENQGDVKAYGQKN
ncbi:MAG: hypothetical protein K2I72_00315 [Bacilli bacterium]|nr:hypothetical protein [Bacilli bacterium]